MTAAFDIRNSAFEISPLIASEQKLLMMRPYQVYQVKNIVQCIHDNCGNGYIWSTTGSGKTLTSFKASRRTTDPRPPLVAPLQQGDGE